MKKSFIFLVAVLLSLSTAFSSEWLLDYEESSNFGCPETLSVGPNNSDVSYEGNDDIRFNFHSHKEIEHIYFEEVNDEDDTNTVVLREEHIINFLDENSLNLSIKKQVVLRPSLLLALGIEEESSRQYHFEDIASMAYENGLFVPSNYSEDDLIDLTESIDADFEYAFQDTYRHDLGTVECFYIKN